jgi:hypothetical protein
MRGQVFFLTAILSLLPLQLARVEATPLETLDTLSDLRAYSGEVPALYMSGYNRTGDGGEGIFIREAAACTDDGVLRIVDGSGHCYRRAVPEGHVNVRWAGAVGDGETDDSQALAAAHAVFLRLAASSDKGAVLTYPPGKYRTSVTLPLPPRGDGWELRGEAMATIIEAQDNIPILRLIIGEGDARRNWSIRQLRLIYAKPQPQQNKNAIAIALGCSGDTGKGIFDFNISNVVFDDAWRGISVDYQTYDHEQRQCPIWGFTIDSVTSYGDMSGATIWLATERGGSPRGSILNFYAQNKKAVEPAISLRSMTQVYGRNWEFNHGTGANVYLQTRHNIIDGIRFEATTVTADNNALVILSGGQTIIHNLEVHNFYMQGNVSAYFLRIKNGDLDLQNVVSSVALGDQKGSWQVIDGQDAGATRFSGSWVRHADGYVRFDFPAPVQGVWR